VPEDDSSLLRLHDEHDERRLFLLHDDERHANLLLDVNRSEIGKGVIPNIERGEVPPEARGRPSLHPQQNSVHSLRFARAPFANLAMSNVLLAPPVA
jgi:hypothetical protein